MTDKNIIKKERPLILKPLFWGKEDIFKEPNKVFKLDYFWSIPNNYCWYSGYNIKLIRELISFFPEEQSLLKILIRRYKYTYALHKEFEYISERFVWKNLPGINDIYLCRFEHIICQITELIDYVVRFYIRNNKDYGGEPVNRFEDIGNFIICKKNGLPDYYHEGINASVDLSILLFIRNSIVHNYENISYSSNKQNPLIICENIPETKRYGVLKRLYLDGVTKLIGFKEESGFKIVTDPRFHLVNHIKLTRNSTVDHQNSKIAFEVETLELVNQFVNKTFYGLIKDILSVLKNNQKF